MGKKVRRELNDDARDRAAFAMNKDFLAGKDPWVEAADRRKVDHLAGNPLDDHADPVHMRR